MREWFDVFDDELWIHRDAREGEAAFLVKALRLRRGSRVLDAPCGEGAVSIELARRGIAVTGVDFRDVAVHRARSAFAAEGLDGRFVVADLREMRLDGEGFDAAFNWYGSFGYFATQDEDLAVLRRLASAVRRGGLVLVDQPNREWVLRHFAARKDKLGVLTVSRWDARTERVETVWRLAGRRGAPARRSSIRMYTPAQLRRLFDAAGLDVVRLWGHWDGSAWSRGARRTIVVGRVPGHADGRRR